MEKVYKQCVLCYCNDYSFQYLVKGFQIVRCKNCGLVRTVIPNNVELGEIYDDTYFQGGQPDGYADYLGSEKAIKKEFRKILKELLKRVDPSTENRLLEIGCAYGYFLDLASQHFNCLGIEISEEATHKANEKGRNVICGIPDKETLGKAGKFNIVVLLDVIEHLSDPAEIMGNLAQFTPQGGLVLLTTGNINSIYARAAGKKWRLMTPPQHVTFFSRKTIRMLLEMNGFKILQITTPSKLVPIGLIFYQLSRIIHTKFPIKIIRFLSRFYMPLNLFDTMKVVAIKT